MQHFNCPGINRYILTSDDKHNCGEYDRDRMNLLINQHLLEMILHVVEHGEHRQLSGHDPRFTLAKLLKIVELNQGGPKEFQ